MEEDVHGGRAAPTSEDSADDMGQVESDTRIVRTPRMASRDAATAALREWVADQPGVVVANQAGHAVWRTPSGREHPFYVAHHHGRVCGCGPPYDYWKGWIARGLDV